MGDKLAETHRDFDTKYGVMRVVIRGEISAQNNKPIFVTFSDIALDVKACYYEYFNYARSMGSSVYSEWSEIHINPPQMHNEASQEPVKEDFVMSELSDLVGTYNLYHIYIILI